MVNVKSEFTLSGLTCSSCEKIIVKKLSRIEGVQEVTVSAPSGSTSILSSRPIMASEISSALEGTHYNIITN